MDAHKAVARILGSLLKCDVLSLSPPMRALLMPINWISVFNRVIKLSLNCRSVAKLAHSGGHTQYRRSTRSDRRHVTSNENDQEPRRTVLNSKKLIILIITSINEIFAHQFKKYLGMYSHKKIWNPSHQGNCKMILNWATTEYWLSLEQKFWSSSIKIESPLFTIDCPR